MVDIWYMRRFLLYKTTPQIRVLIDQQSYGEYNAQKLTNLCLSFAFRIVTISNFPLAALPFWVR